MGIFFLSVGLPLPTVDCHSCFDMIFKYFHILYRVSL